MLSSNGESGDRPIKQGGRTGKKGGEQDGWSNTGKPIEFSNNSINVLKMLGPNPMAHTVMNTMNAVKVTPSMIPGILQNMAFGDDIGRIPMDFTPSTDVFSLILTENSAARLAGRQAFSYFILADDAFQAQWLPPEAICGLVHFVKEDMMLATDNLRKDSLSLVNGLSKTFEKLMFFCKREHWIIAWTRAQPILLATGQWTMASWIVHFDHICMLYELNKVAGNDYLITFYEDRVRKYFADKCARGDIVDLVSQCGKTHAKIMDMCKARLHTVLQAAGLQYTPASRQNFASSDVAASAVAKQQAMWDADSKKQKSQAGAVKQRQDSFDKKVEALQQSQPKDIAIKYTKSWNTSSKGRAKGRSKVDLKPYRGANTGGQSPGKGKRKSKGKQYSNWNKDQSQW